MIKNRNETNTCFFEDETNVNDTIEFFKKIQITYLKSSLVMMKR